MSPTLMSLPDDLLLSCLACVSRLNYRTLFFVSNKFRSLIASPEFNKARSLLGRHTESCLFVCIEFYIEKPSWFTLCRKPNKTLIDDDTICKKKKKSSRYVLAKAPIPDFSSYMCSEAATYCVIENVWYSSSSKNELRWYDTEARKWINLKGLIGLPKKLRNHVRLAGYGGKMVVLWEDNTHYISRNKMIWCAEIVLENRRKNCREIWGKVEWLERVYTIRKLFPN